MSKEKVSATGFYFVLTNWWHLWLCNHKYN